MIAARILPQEGGSAIAKGFPAGLDWLLHEDDGERSVPVSERVEIADENWRATTERLAVGTGMRVFLTSADVRRTVTLEPRHGEAEPWLVSNIAVEGRVALALSDGYSTEITTERSVLYRPVDLRARYTPAPGQKLRLAGYMLSADRVRLMLGDELPAMIAKLIERVGGTSQLFEISATARLRQSARTLFTNRLRGALRLLFFEGVVLRLLAMQTSERRSPKSALKALSARDRDAVDEAHRRLLADMRSPPTLAALAASVDMSEKALNAGFRALYGTTVFETLRNQRLEHARIALARLEFPIKHIAFRVGYDHVTNFINAFTARYGAPPRQYTEARATAEGERPH